mgnify:FL=1
MNLRNNMDDFQSINPINDDKFKLGKKWFWIGIIAGFLNSLTGLIYGIALLVERQYRKEGLIIIVWAIVWFLIVYYFILPWLTELGYVPKFQVIK